MSDNVTSKTWQQEYTVNAENGFKNIVPQGRDSRRVEGDKQSLERTRLANRREGFQRHSSSTNPLEMDENAAGFISDADRFHTAVADEEKARREYEYQKKQRILERIRKERMERDEKRYQDMQDRKKQEDEYWSSKVGTSRANESKTAYDLITLKPKDPKDFPLEHYKQEMFEYRGRLRASELYAKQNNAQGYNPITGEKLPERIVVPPKPEMPHL